LERTQAGRRGELEVVEQLALADVAHRPALDLSAEPEGLLAQADVEPAVAATAVAVHAAAPYAIVPSGVKPSASSSSRVSSTGSSSRLASTRTATSSSSPPAAVGSADPVSPAS